MTPRDEATERQVQAARPDASTWLAANAGSGKTRVLTDRVARLLMAGVQPQNILCLTYTKAAASEMQNRLFKRLGEWAMLDDTRLASALTVLGVDGAITTERMRHARTLFARAIEAPGGLKIQTIHSFCSSLLRRFPLEAGVSPQFTEVEDRAARLLQQEIVEDFANGDQAALLDGVAQYISDNGFDGLTAMVLGKRAAFTGQPDRAAIMRLFDLPEDLDENAILGRVFLGDEKALLARLITALQGGGKTDQSNANKLASIKEFDLKALPILENVFLTGAGAKDPFAAKIGSFPTKSVQKDNPALMDEVENFMRRVKDTRAARLGLATVEKSLALHRFAAAFVPEYERRKQVRGWLDFDDLILKARQLLNDPAVAAWVLYRLDGGIDHILVDEAQDTSPEQWDVVEKLAQEFTSGLGAREDVERTIFVVGDKKQSIYSFQGADPDAFDRMQAEFGARLNAKGSRLFDLELEFSFRSAETILRLVDLVFDGRGEAGFSPDSKHRAFKSDLPGRVDLWPCVEKVADDEDQPWTDPLDRPSPRHHTVILAEQIAAEIKRQIETSETIPDEDAEGLHRRPVKAGDFLILVQRRSDLFAEIIRACKSAGLPIAGADRLKVGAELAVKDLGALLMFLATPEDNLSLATALKSPLFGWSEQQLFDLAHRRKNSFLWQSLRDRAGEFPETLSVLYDLRDQADFLRPFDLIERILTRHDGRQTLLGRLGAEAEDGINALLSQALAYERVEIPNLTGFLAWMETDDLEIKRQMGNAGNMIRVMTVHGSKGLESPIVILPDTAKRQIGGRGDLSIVDGQPVWRPPAAELPRVLQPSIDSAKQGEINERQRLLYVALTRAEKRLIVASAGDLDKNGDSWYQIIEAAMRSAGATERDFPGGPGLELVDDAWTNLPIRSPESIVFEKQRIPDVFSKDIPDVVVALETLSPSELGGAKALAGAEGETEEIAKLRGTRIHTLLEHLPAAMREDHELFADRLVPGLTVEERADILGEAQAVLANPDLTYLLGPDALAEVPITANIGSRRVHGVIDRLVVTEKDVLAVDFKTNATVPATPELCPEGLLRQMGAYLLALKQIYPDRTCRVAILWTRDGSLMELSHDLVTDALARTPELDLGASRS